MTEKAPLDQAFDQVLGEKLQCTRTTLAYFGNFEDCVIYLIESGPELWIWSILKGREIVDMGTAESKDIGRFQAAKILGIGEEPKLEWTVLEKGHNDQPIRLSTTYDKHDDKAGTLAKAVLFVEKKDESSLPWEIKIFRGENLWAEGWAANRNAACLDAEHMVGAE